MLDNQLYRKARELFCIQFALMIVHFIILPETAANEHQYAHFDSVILLIFLPLFCIFSLFLLPKKHFYSETHCNGI